MDLCIPYKNYYKYNDLAKEFDIIYKKDSSIKKLLEFCQEYKDKIINIEFEDETDILEVMSFASLAHDNIKIKLTHEQSFVIDSLKEKQYKFYFKDSPAYNLTSLNSLIALGVSDVYLIDDLCYDLEAVSKRCQEKNVRLRVILNLIPTFDSNLIDYSNIIYRPEETQFIEPYYDVCEFSIPKKQFNVLNVYIETWLIKKQWNGDLREIIPGLNFHYPNNCIGVNILKTQLNCNRRCYLNSKCSKCQHSIEFAQTLYSKNFFVKK